jgi:glycosyltransferase involved in cell wall biosynthesis
MRVGIDARKLADFGIGTYIRGLLRGLVALKAGDEYVAFAPAGTQLPDGVEHVVVDAPHYSLRELFVIGRAAERARVDLFHAPHYVVPATRLPLVVTIHDLIHLHQPMRNPIAPLYARTMLRRAVHKARCVLTVTNAVKVQLETELGAKNVLVTPNGVDPPSPPAASTTTNRQPPTANFLYVGNDKPHKNASTLLDAFARLRATMPEATLVMVGGDFSRHANDHAGVDARGFVGDDELSALYSTCTALVMPSLEEGFGLPALEAMAHGAAVITSRDPALVEVTGDAALHADARDAEALAAAMLRVAREPGVRASLTARGLERARFFTWKRCAEATREAYLRGTSWNIG